MTLAGAIDDEMTLVIDRLINFEVLVFIYMYVKLCYVKFIYEVIVFYRLLIIILVY